MMMTSVVTDQASSFRATIRWRPTTWDLLRGRVLSLKTPRQPDNLTIAEFAKRARSTPHRVMRDVRRRRLLALELGPHLIRIPAWQMDNIKLQLARRLLARNVDQWTIHWTLTEPIDYLTGKTPIQIVNYRNWRRLGSILVSELGFHD